VLGCPVIGGAWRVHWRGSPVPTRRTAVAGRASAPGLLRPHSKNREAGGPAPLTRWGIRRLQALPLQGVGSSSVGAFLSGLTVRGKALNLSFQASNILSAPSVAGPSEHPLLQAEKTEHQTRFFGRDLRFLPLTFSFDALRAAHLSTGGRHTARFLRIPCDKPRRCWIRPLRLTCGHSPKRRQR